MENYRNNLARKVLALGVSVTLGWPIGMMGRNYINSFIYQKTKLESQSQEPQPRRVVPTILDEQPQEPRVIREAPQKIHLPIITPQIYRENPNTSYLPDSYEL